MRTTAGIKSNGRAFWKALDSDGTSWAVELEGEKGNVDPSVRSIEKRFGAPVRQKLGFFRFRLVV